MSARDSRRQQRIVVLGASNVARSFARIVSLARQQSAGPLEFLAAIGHGRSYGRESRVFGRKISGILSCGLWDELGRRSPLPTAALVADVGNDILYGRSPGELLRWVGQCLDRLSESAAATVVVTIPVDQIERLDPARFLLFRTLLFPNSRLTLASVKSLAREVNAGLVELAEQRKNTIFPVRNEWYGFDPIHIRRRSSRAAWHEILAGWPTDSSPDGSPRSSLWQAAFLHLLPPLERSWLGVCRRRAQPSGVLPDGTTISLY